MIEVSSGQESFLKLVAALNDLAEAFGVGIQVTANVPKIEDVGTYLTEEREEKVRRQRRSDFAWLQTTLTGSPDMVVRLSGKYVAVYNERIVSAGPDRDLTMYGAAKQLGLEPDEILVVPVQVAGSEEDWDVLRCELGIE